jgi:hypothetical protein
VVGTPQECLDRIYEVQRMIGLNHMVTEFGYGGMPHEEALLNMRLFADQVMPTLQRDPAFTVADEEVWGDEAMANQAAAAAAQQAGAQKGDNVFTPV